MRSLKYVLAKPVQVLGVGKAHPFTLNDYDESMEIFNILQLQVNLFLQEVPTKEKSRRKFIVDNLKNWDVICLSSKYIEDLVFLIKAVFKFDDKCEIVTNWHNKVVDMINSRKISLEKNSLIGLEDEKNLIELGSNTYLSVNGFEINRNNYDFFREEIIKLNLLRFPKVAKTIEMQKRLNKKYEMDSKESGQDLEDIITTVAMEISKFPSEMRSCTLYELNSMVARINKKYEFLSNIQFICAGATDIKLESIVSHIDILKENDDGLLHDAKGFMNKTNNMLGGR